MIPRPVSFPRSRLGGLMDALKKPNAHCQMATKTRVRDDRSEASSTTPQSSHLPSLLLPTETDSMPESPYGLTRTQFRHYGKETIDFIVNYLENIHKRRVFPEVDPGYIRSSIPSEAPQLPESWEAVMNDFENLILPGVTHWQHPRFHAYFPAGNSYPSMLAEMLGDSLGSIGFSWSSCPAMTELEVVMLDWFGKMMGLPDAFLSEGGRGGGGVIQGSASDCTFVALLSARYAVMKDLIVRYPLIHEGQLLSKLVAYCSKEAHTSVEKACRMGMIKLRILETDSKARLRGETLKMAIQEDLDLGLIPFFVSSTLGTTSCCSFDVLSEIGPVCEDNNIWLHVDAAYAGSAMICPELREPMKGIEYAMSFNTNPTKFMLVNFDCSTMWVKDHKKLTEALTVDAVYLNHNWSLTDKKTVDYRNWGVPLSRRFRSLKLWFVIRMYGVEGLQKYIREHVRLAKMMKELLMANKIFEIVGDVHLGLVSFRMKGSDERNRKLLDHLNATGRIHMVPAKVNERFVIRFCVSAESTTEKDIETSYEIIAEAAKDFPGETNETYEREQIVGEKLGRRDCDASMMKSSLDHTQPMKRLVVHPIVGRREGPPAMLALAARCCQQVPCTEHPDGSRCALTAETDVSA